jgi:uncharacterized repeat protein (TIGR01451 family)
VIGLDSNDVNVGPNNFPVGARVCNTSEVDDATNVVSTFEWDTTDPYVSLRPDSYGTVGNPFPIIPTLAAGACVDIYYETQVTRDANAYNHSARYHITATADDLGITTTTTPQELYIEHLISQSRNYNLDLQLNGSSIQNGGFMNLFVGETYTITLISSTATNGYEQIESFINFDNTIFQIISVNSTYSASSGDNSIHKLYYDACTWDSDPNSPNYRSCLDVGKAGGQVVNTYVIRIISGGGAQETLSNLIYDFSGSSYHYNSDYAVTYRFANIIDPTSASITKRFSPNPTQAGGFSTLTITLHNPNNAILSGANFTDTLPTTPGVMVVANPPNATTSGCGTPTFAPTAGAASLSFSNGAIAANGDCVIRVDVTVPTTGAYVNTTGNLYIGTVDTGHNASASLVVNNNPPAPACTPGMELATWTFEGTGTISYTFKSRRVITDPTQTIVGPLTNGVVPAPVGGTSNAWYADNFVKSSWVPPADPTNPYFEFVVDTRNFTNVSLAFRMAFYGNDWSNAADNIIYAYSIADGVTFDNIIYNSGHIKNIWYLESAAAATTGSNTTTFRIYAAGAQKDYAQLYIDDIVITGCGVPQPPSITKAFSPNPVAVNGVSTLTFTFSNENNVPMTGVTFTDDLPTGLQVADPPYASTTCGGAPTWAPTAGATSLTFGSPTGATIAARSGTTFGSCTAQVDILATSAGPHLNVSGYISANETGTNTGTDGFATASLTAIQAPQISKQFAPNPILSGGVSTLTFVIANPNPDYPLTGVTFNDVFPTSPESMVVATPPNASTTNCGSPNFTPIAGASSVSFGNVTGGTIAAGGICTLKVDITATITGSYANNSGPVSATTAGIGNSASDTLLVQAVHPNISILKQVSSSLSGPWTIFTAVTLPSNIYYRFTVENSGDVPLTNVNVTDPILVTTPPHIVCTLDSLALYEVKTCETTSIPAISGSHENTATAHGMYNNTVYDSTPSSASYATAALTLVKSVTETAFAEVGDVLHYNYVVTNSGNASLRGPVTVTDDKIGLLSCPATETVGDNDAFLDVPESIICTGTYTVLAADVAFGSVTNVAFATASAVNSNTDHQTVGRAASDYDDLPAAYDNTLQSENGAHHTTGNLYMGADVSTDPDGQPDANANVDTFDDGVTRGTQLWVNGATVDILIDLSTSVFPGPAAAGIWIDWNNNAVFDPATDFYPCTGLAAGGVRTCQIVVPGNLFYTVGNSVFARVRLFDQAHLPGSGLEASDFAGLANNGEVEAYLWPFSPTAVRLVNMTARTSRLSVLPWLAGILLLSGGLGLVMFARHTKQYN